ncbi:YadA-like family protein [Burkholderia multivorans]|uniref:YadA-like family protein n=1 Tax=Burkholderia multivorans TaxID=87883 RepID=UPI002018CAFB|nr:YadA-like family protein [Burkholderia multivorans]MCO1370224.1 YadA-like family protein [Burkholderia multivorans]MCO1459523.1 YadA-like family protein [Burkholderia multivorans]MCO1467512.1 YadA-like family protein [Burkholderia multivorans]UQO20724.1 YadA-like family protein [Burkholderia multivorans]UQO84328.1 YadA-like family protein [Burkholderia multivorans]
MNTSYRIVWSESHGKWVVASELAKGRKKNGASKRIRRVLAVVAAAGAGATPAMANLYVIGSGGQTSYVNLNASDIVKASGNQYSMARAQSIIDTVKANPTQDYYIRNFNVNGQQYSYFQYCPTGTHLDPATTTCAAGASTPNATDPNWGTGTAPTTKQDGTHYFKANGLADGTDDAQATGVYATAAGVNALASGGGATALGHGANATGVGSIALGESAVAGADYSTAIGSSAQSSGLSSFAAGNQARAAGTSALALGDGAVAQGNNALAIGTGAVATRASSGGSQYYDFSGTAIGSGATALGGDNVALGRNTSVTGQYAGTAIGSAANVTDNFGTAVGNSAGASARYGTAVGSRAEATAHDATAVGANTVADRANTLSVGSSTIKRQIVNVAAGTEDNDAVNVAQLKSSGLIDSDGKAHAALTYDLSADGSINYSSATLGVGKASNGVTLSNIAAGKNDLDAVNVAQLKSSGLVDSSGKALAAVTYDRNADGTTNYRSVTVGNGSGAAKITNVANGSERSDAVNYGQLSDALQNASNPYIGGRGTGTAAQATAIGSVALGLNSVANEVNTISVGNAATGLARRITNVADGQAVTDAATVGQVNDLVGGVSTSTKAALDAFGTKLASIDQRAVSIDAVVGTDPYVRVDGAGDGTDNASVRDGSYGIAIGADASSTGDTAIAVGVGSAATGASSVAVGVGATARGTGAVAVGQATVNGRNAIGLGNGTAASADNAVALGFNSTAAGTNALAFGNTANARAADSLALGTLSDVNAQATNSIALGRSAQVNAAASNSVALGAGSVADRLNTISVGSAGTERQIVNVAAGTQNTDAVNVSQLRGVTNALGGNAAIGADGSITAPTYNIGGTNYRTVGEALAAVAAGGGGGTDSNAVVYDSAAKDKVTLGGADATTPVTLSNVAAGSADTDAVNVKQLKDTGLVATDPNNDGQLTSLAVTYDSTAKDKVTLGGADATTPVTLSNVAAGSADTDAVNVKQLKDSGLVATDPNNDGQLTSLAVTYDSTAKDKVTLGGAGSTTPVTLSNVAAGSADTDAVNVKQLKDSGLVATDPNNDGQLTSLAVTYDSTAKDKVTLGGADATTPVTLSNVAAGSADTDAVNVKQLKDSGLVATDPNNDGQLTSLAVTYDSTAKDKVTLGGADATTPVTLSNVAAGAVNADSTDAINGAQLHGTAQSVADALGGGSTVNIDGTISAPAYTVGGTTVRNVGDALTNLDGRVTTNTTNITNIQTQLADAGLVDPTTGKAIAAVTYDRNADGSPNYDAVTLGAGKASGPVVLKNVAAGTDDTDAVNVKQLKDSGLVATDPNNDGQLTSLAVTYDGTAKDKVTLGGAGSTTPVTLTNVAAGAVHADSTDAINGAQLHGTATSVANTLGGGTTVDANGNLTGSAFDVNGSKYKTVEEAIQAAAAYGATDSKAVRYDLNPDGSTNFGQVTLGGSGAAPVVLTNVADGKNQYDAVNFGQLSNLQNQVVDLSSTVNFIDNRVTKLESGTVGGGWNYDAVNNKIVNVANGTISAGSQDAVNGGQVYATTQSVADALGGGAAVDANGKLTAPSFNVGGQTVNTVSDAVSNLDQRIGGVQGQVDQLSRNAYSGIAAATALSMIPGVDQGKNFSLGIAGATYRGYQAMAIGAEARVTQNLKVRAGVGLAQGGNSAGLGASYQW